MTRPDPGGISKQTAIDLARESLVQALDIPAGYAASCEQVAVFGHISEGEESPVWVVSFSLNPDAYNVYVVTLDAASGRVLDAQSIR
jgi:hypothetical protein